MITALALLLLALPAPAREGVSFYIESCSLLCSDGAAGGPVACGMGNVPVDAQLRFAWSDDVDPASVSVASFSILDLTTGIAPTGTFLLKDARTVLFTPLGGWDPSAVYQLRIPGTAQGDAGPFVASTAGVPNLARAQCVFAGNLPPQNVQTACGSTPNSVGPGACTSWQGFPSLTGGPFQVATSGLPPGRAVLYLASNSPASLPMGDGTLCLGPPALAAAPPTRSDPAGSAGLDVDWSALPPGLVVVPGQSVFLQALYRDPPGGPAGFNASDALRIDVAP